MRRVVITGVGMVTPLACGAEETWAKILAGENAAERIDNFQVDDVAAQIACQIPFGDGSNGTFNPDDWMEPKEQRKVDPFIIYGVAASDMALNDADWHPTKEEDCFRTGVLLGSGIGGLQGIEQTSLTFPDD
jgi:3-oxoacyl-[acyl-carrier-protein] synthase II